MRRFVMMTTGMQEMDGGGWVMYEEARALEYKNEQLRENIIDLREFVWLCDIPSPTVPEYIEWHQKIQEILSFIDEKLLEGSGE